MKSTSRSEMVLRYIAMCDEPVGVADLAREVNISLNYAALILHRLHDAKVIHISGYVVRGRAARVYTFGPGQDVDKPSVHQLRLEKIMAEKTNDA